MLSNVLSSDLIQITMIRSDQMTDQFFGLKKVIQIRSFFRSDHQLLCKFLYKIDLEIPSTKTRNLFSIFTLVYFQITIIVHLITFAFDVSYWPLLMYIRNQLIGLSFLCSCIQILDFLSFHHLFGPWAIIISSLVVDTLKFLVVLMIFEVGFTMMFLTMNQPYYLLGKFCYFIGEVNVHLKCEFLKLF